MSRHENNNADKKKAERYSQLVKESQKFYRDNPDEHKTSKVELVAPDDDKGISFCEEINLYTYWQGLGYAKKTPHIKYLLVGQDWGNPFIGRDDFINRITAINSGIEEPYYEKGVFDTDDNLVELFKVLKDSSGGPYDIAHKRYTDLFFSNFCLGYRTGKESGSMTKGLMKKDAEFFKRLVEFLEPDNILCLGKRTFECVYEVLCGDKKKKPEGFKGKYNDFIEKYVSNSIIASCGEKKNIRIFPLAHPGYMGIMNRINKKGKYADGLNAQKDDWEKISKKKLFSDRRWTDPPAAIMVGKIKPNKEDEIICIDFLLRRGIVDKDEYQRMLKEINEKYSDEKSGDENADDK